jgi:hypothetical protein
MKGADMTVGAIPWSRLPITKNSRLHKKHNELCYYKSNSVNLVCIIRDCLVHRLVRRITIHRTSGLGV